MRYTLTIEAMTDEEFKRIVAGLGAAAIDKLAAEADESLKRMGEEFEKRYHQTPGDEGGEAAVAAECDVLSAKAKAAHSSVLDVQIAPNDHDALVKELAALRPHPTVFLGRDAKVEVAGLTVEPMKQDNVIIWNDEIPEKVKHAARVRDVVEWVRSVIPGPLSAEAIADFLGYRKAEIDIVALCPDLLGRVRVILEALGV